MAYDFSTLNDKDLEELSRDILAKKIGIDFQSFKSGSDSGIDLRYATNNNENEIIVQVKHYITSGISKLKSDLKKKEALKVKQLNPNRYVLVTSLPLSPKNKEDIKGIFSPYIKSTNDILGKNDLNSFLRNNKEIETAHFKLWLSSTNVLTRILANSVKGRSEFYEKKIKNRIKIFVPNRTHRQAVETLNKYNFILITGAPGIGKSTLADMLSYQLLAEEFELIYVREITEAENLFETGKKQVFYFDDFLGAITLDLKSSRNADSAIANFVERIKSDKQKRLILTCRTTILNQAKEESEKLEKSKIEISSHEVKIEDYRDLDKARILYNHIYFSSLSEELKEVFFKDKFYWKVIKHKHYNPRIIEFFTDVERLQSGIDYSQEIIGYLDNPSHIWEKSYTVQISIEAKLFLSTLYSLGGKYVVSEKKLKEAFDARIEYEVLHNNYTKSPNVFNKVFRELEGGFVVRIHTIEKNYSIVEFRFLNPSIEDFLHQYFNKNIDEYFIVLKAAIYFAQFQNRITTRESKFERKIYFGEPNNRQRLYAILKERLEKINDSGVSKDLNTVITLLRHFDWQDVSGEVIEIMNQLSTSSYFSWDDRDNLIEILTYLAKNNLIKEFNFPLEEILLSLSLNMSSYFQIESFAKLIANCEVYGNFVEDSRNYSTDFYSTFRQNIDRSWESIFEYYIANTSGVNELIDRADLISKIDDKRIHAKEINKQLKLNPSPIIDQYIYNYDDQLQKNMLKNGEKDTLITNLRNDDDDNDNESIQINRLFNSKELEILDDELPF